MPSLPGDSPWRSSTPAVSNKGCPYASDAVFRSQVDRAFNGKAVGVTYEGHVQAVVAAIKVSAGRRRR
jgi:hypothetical protein